MLDYLEPYFDLTEAILKLLLSYQTYLYIFLVYYLIKNRSDWQKMSYQLFAVTTFFSVIALCFKLYPFYKNTIGLLYLWVYVGSIYLLYGLIAYFLENDKKPRYNMNIWVLLLVTVFSLGTYVPIWIMKKYKQYNIKAKYFWLVLVYLYFFQLHYNLLVGHYGEIYHIKNIHFIKLFAVLFIIIWTIVILFFLQNQIEKKSKVIEFKQWYFTLLFGILYIQYKINDEVKFFKKKEQAREQLEQTAHYTP